jgi:hypothetical protein
MIPGQATKWCVHVRVFACIHLYVRARAACACKCHGIRFLLSCLYGCLIDISCLDICLCKLSVLAREIVVESTFLFEPLVGVKMISPGNKSIPFALMQDGGVYYLGQPVAIDSSEWVVAQKVKPAQALAIFPPSEFTRAYGDKLSASSVLNSFETLLSGGNRETFGVTRDGKLTPLSKVALQKSLSYHPLASLNHPSLGTVKSRLF